MVGAECSEFHTGLLISKIAIIRANTVIFSILFAKISAILF